MKNPQIEGFCNPEFSDLEDIFSQAIKSGFDDGAGFSLEIDGKEVVNLWGGFSDKDHQKAWQKDTLVNVFSVTKAMTSTCALQLIESGKLNPDALVSDYWPEYACAGKEDTKVIDFLTHRAGMFGFQGGMPDLPLSDWDGWTKKLSSQSPFREPGSSQGYHALTYGWLVGEIIRRVDGRSVGQYFKEEIADPFGIDFKIGLGLEDLDRCADILPDPRTESMIMKLLPYMPDFMLPGQLKALKQILKGGDYQVAFESFEGDQEMFNSIEWSQAEIPSANGHGTAESLAKLFGILSTGCERGGNRIFSEETLNKCLQPLSEGPDTVLFGAGIKFGIGFDLGLGITTIGQPDHPNSIFGHCGIGGCVAFGDKENQIGYAFLCNRMHNPQELYKSTNSLTSKLFEII